MAPIDNNAIKTICAGALGPAFEEIINRSKGVDPTLTFTALIVCIGHCLAAVAVELEIAAHDKLAERAGAVMVDVMALELNALEA